MTIGWLALFILVGVYLAGVLLFLAMLYSPLSRTEYRRGERFMLALIWPIIVLKE